MTKSYIWSLPTRAFHWLLVLYILIIFLTSDSERLLDIHVAFGYGVGVLILFRVCWLFWGPTYSKIGEFNLSIKKAIDFGLNLFSNKKSYAGHNPAASFVMLGIIAILFLTSLTGLFVYGIQEAKGVLGFLNNSMFKNMKLFEEIHESFSTLLIIAIFAHLMGIFIDRILHKKDRVLESMIDGYKRVPAKDVKLNRYQKTFATIMLTIALITPIVALALDTPLTKSRYEKIEYEKLSSIFVEECASCHIIYPPFLLPKRSWEKMMSNLENHFGDDASLDNHTKKEIERFLVKNASENSTKESAFYISRSIKDDIIAITDTSYWKKRHDKIDKSIFKSKRVRTKSNCKACHRDFESGLIEDALIKKLEL